VEVTKDAADSCHPTYSALIADEWKSGVVTASADSIEINLTMRDRIEWMTEWSRWTPFKKRECKSVMLTANPDVEISGLRTFTVKCDCRNNFWLGTGLGAIVGTGLGFGGGYLYSKK
jgi:hypothetical protein